MNKIQEVWKPIDEFDGFYEISNFGRVKAIEHYKKIRNNGLQFCPERFLAQNTFKGRSPYPKVSLKYKDKRKMYNIHRLVAMYFVPNPFNLPFVNHIDGDKTNNRVDNLEWCTCKENNEHARNKKLNKMRYMVGVVCNETGEYFRSVRDLSRKINYAYGTILEHLKGNPKRKSIRGLTYRKVDKKLKEYNIEL